MKTQPLGPFLGINNRLPDFALGASAGRFLRVADNIDIDNAGDLRRRRAPVLVQAMSGAHSWFANSENAGFLVRASVLYAVTLPEYAETLLAVLASDDPMSYQAIGADVYASNGTDKLRISAGAVFPHGLPTPAAPVVGDALDGALLPGRYQIAVSYSNSMTGEEGGVSPVMVHELTATGGITVTLPGVMDGADKVNVYMSGANGSAPMWLATLASDAASYDCMALSTGREAAQRFEAPLPAGRLFVSNGRLCSIAGATVYIGLPYRYGYYLPLEGAIPFPAAVSIAIENEGGTFIVADKTYWFPGDLGDIKGAVSEALPYGAVPGTEFALPEKAGVGWFGDRGVVVAMANGPAEPLTANNIDLTAPASGHSVVLETDGFVRVLSCGFCVNLENKAATSYSDWAFTSVSGRYGTKADGFYALSGGTVANATIGFGKEDFGAEEIKHLPAVYALVACEASLELTVIYVDDQGVEQEYTFTTRGASASMAMQRFDTAKGMRSNWFDLTIRNQDGADFTLASVSFAPAASTRRI